MFFHVAYVWTLLLDVDFNPIVWDYNGMDRYSNKLKGLEMGGMSDWAIDHDESIGRALESGAVIAQDVIAYCKTNMQYVDENYIREQLKLYTGEI